MLFFIKNNPEKLLGKFKKTNETELKTKIIIQLIKLDAEKEILEIFKENKTEIIEYYLFEKYKDNPGRLFWLYQNGVDKQKTIGQLIKLDAEKEILEIFKENKTEIIEYYLFEKYKDNPERLFWLYQNDVDKQKTIGQLIKLNAEKEILEIFKENKTKIIQKYLFEKYKDNPGRLFWLYQKGVYKQKTIEQLIKLDAEKEILEIFKENKTKIIEYYLFGKYKDKPERLYWLYQNGVDKQKTIEQMIKLDAEKEILEIFKENKTKIIQNYLFEKYKDNPGRLFWLYQRSDIKEKIIYKLINLNADKYILRLLGIENNRSLIILISDYLIDKSKDITLFNKIFEINTNTIREKIISKLIKLGDLNELENVYLNRGFNKYFLSQLVENKINRIEDILLLYKKVYALEDKLLIINKLMELMVESKSGNIIDKESLAKKLISFLVTIYTKGKREQQKKNYR